MLGTADMAPAFIAFGNDKGERQQDMPTSDIEVNIRSSVITGISREVQ